MKEIEMKTLDIEIAVMEKIGVRQNIIIPNISWGMNLGSKLMHECDLLSLSKNGYATEIEIKVSKADLLKDRFKKHAHDHPHIKYLWFAVPEKLSKIALAEIPERAGLYVVQEREAGEFVVRIRKQPMARKHPVKWTERERIDLMRLGVMRIITLKRQLSRILRITKINYESN